MIEALIVALSPFILNSVMGLAKWFGNLQTTAGKRFVLALLSIFGVLAFSALNGTPVDTNSISSLVTVAMQALAAFLMAHGSYVLFWQKAAPAPGTLDLTP
jgi:hypothetical protein